MAERVQSVERAFAILQALHGQQQTLTQLVDATGLAKSTVSRLLSTLVAVGAVAPTGDSGLYELGLSVTALGATRSLSLTSVAAPVLRQLAKTVGESAGLGIRDFFDVLYTLDLDADTSVQLRTWVGARVPMHAVPSGIVLLSGMTEAAREEFLAQPLRPFTERTIVDADEVRAKIESFRHHGVVWGRGEFSSDINSVAAGVCDCDGRVVAAVHMHGPAYRFPGDQSDISESLVREAASIISRAIASATHLQLREDFST